MPSYYRIIIFLKICIDFFAIYVILILVTVPIIKKKGELLMIKHSRQREAIRENLMTRCDHPTAESVYMDIKEAWGPFTEIYLCSLI